MNKKSKKFIIPIIGSLFIIFLGYFVINLFRLIHIKESGPGIKNSSIPSNLYVYRAKWSPNGTKIAFIADKLRDIETATSIYIYDVLSKNVELLPTTAGKFPVSGNFYPNKLKWSPDGTKLYVSGKFSGQSGYSRIWVVDLDSYEMEQFSQGESLTWSPDGSQIAILDTEVDSSKVRLVDAQGNEVQVIYEFKHSGSSRTFMNIEWSPYGDILAIAAAGVTHDGYADNIYLLRVDGTKFKPLIMNSTSWQLVSPTWYPDSQWLAFVAFDPGQRTVKFAPITGECVYSWLPQIKNADNVDLAADGKTALVVSWGDLYIVDLEKAARPPISDGQPKCP